MAPSKLERQCPAMYFRLPNPQDVLAPCDTELTYMAWMPGFEWTPLPVYEEEVEEVEGEDEAEVTDADLKEALAEMVEQDEMKQKFNEISGGGGNTTPEKAAQLARQLGLAPSNEDVAEMEKTHGSSVNYATFQAFCTVCTHPEDKVDDMIAALSIFDVSSSGTISSKQLRNILTTMGENLTEDEINGALKSMMGGKETANIKEVCESILARQ